MRCPEPGSACDTSGQGHRRTIIAKLKPPFLIAVFAGYKVPRHKASSGDDSKAALAREVGIAGDPVPVPQGRGRLTDCADGHTRPHSEDGVAINIRAVLAVCAPFGVAKEEIHNGDRRTMEAIDLRREFNFSSCSGVICLPVPA